MDFVIVGIGRSGTSLLQSMLSSHSKTCLPPETGFLRKAVLSEKRPENVRIEVLLRKYPRIKRLTEIRHADLDGSKRTTALLFYQFIEEVYKHRTGKEVFGDKDPRLIESIERLVSIWPDVRIIHIIRDPRDVQLSKRKAKWSKNRSPVSHIIVNYIQMHLFKLARIKYRENIITIRYEDLLGSPQSTLGLVCSFLGIEYESNMLTYQDAAERLIAKEEMAWKGNTTGPLLINNVGKWRGRLSKWEIYLVERVCRESMVMGQYSAVEMDKEYSLMSRAVLSVSSHICVILAKITLLCLKVKRVMIR